MHVQPTVVFYTLKVYNIQQIKQAGHRVTGLRTIAVMLSGPN